MELCGKYSIMDSGAPVGELEVSPQGAYLRFRAVCRSGRREVFRLAAEDGGKTVPLGVMTPLGSGWSLDRRFSPRELERLGLRHIESCRLLGGSEGWREEPEPQRLFRDETLRQVCLELRGALSRQSGELTLLAVPLNGKQPFPALPIFCFGEAGKIDGKTYVIFAVRAGELTFNPPETGQTKPGVPATDSNQESGE